MKEKFYGYYKPTEEEFKTLWEDALFVVDTNVLLDMFRFSEEAVEVLLNTIEKLQDRLWLPYRVAFEYHRNLNDIIAEQVKNYEDTIKTLSCFRSDLTGKNHPFLDDEFNEEVTNFCEKFDKELDKKKQEIEELLFNNPRKERIANIFNGKVGEEYEIDEEFRKDADERYKKKIPPGYKDKNKQGDEQYGDYLIWKDIMEKGKIEKKSIIFITRDVKEDWFLEKRGKTLGPRPELIQEFEKETQKKFYAYQTTHFLKFSNTYLNSGIKDTIITEVERITKEQKDRSITEAVRTEPVYNTENTTMTIHSMGSTSSESSLGDSVTEQTASI